MTKFYRMMFILTILLLASLACNLGARRPSTPTPEVVSPDLGVGQPTQDTSGNELGGDRVVLVLDEEQLTDIVDAALQSQGDAPIEDPQVQLENGQIKFTGQTVNQPIQAEVYAVMTVQINQSGQLDLEIISADLGPFPVPQAMLDEVKGHLESSLQENLQARMPGVRLESITINDGEMTIVGRSV